MESKKLLPLGGIVFVALVASGVALSITGGAPDSTARGSEVASYFEAHWLRELVVSFLLAAAVPFLVLFALGAAAARATESVGTRVWERMLVGGSLVSGAAFLVTATVNLALADGANNGASSGALEALNLFNGSAWLAQNAGHGILMLGAAGTFLSRPRSRGWLGWTALPLGIALFVPFASFFAVLLTAVWIVVASVALVRGRTEPASAAAPRLAQPRSA